MTVDPTTSLTTFRADRVLLAGWIRGHWQIGNQLHWVRDLTFAEGRSRLRTGRSRIFHSNYAQCEIRAQKSCVHIGFRIHSTCM